MAAAGAGPVDAQAPGILRSGRALAPDPVDPAQDVRLVELGGGATELVPASRVGHQQAAVGVLRDVRGMEVAIAGDQEVGVPGREGRAAGLQDVARHLVQVEEACKQVAPVFAAEDPGGIDGLGAGGGRAQVEHGRQQVPGPGVAGEDVVRFSENAAMDGVDDSVPAAQFRMLDKGGRQQALSPGCEDDVHRVVHSSRQDRLDPGISGPPPEDVGGAGDQWRAARPFVGLLGEGSLGPVDPTVQSQVGTMKIVGATGEGLAREPLLPPVGDAVAIGIRQLPDAGRRRHVERAVEPEGALGNHHAVGERRAPVETSVSVRVFQALDAVRFLLQLLLHRVVGTGGLGHVEPSLLVEIDGNGTFHQRRPGDELHLEPFGHRQQGVIGRVVDPDEQVQQSGNGKQEQPPQQGRARKPGFHGYGLPPAQEMVRSD